MSSRNSSEWQPVGAFHILVLPQLLHSYLRPSWDPLYHIHRQWPFKWYLWPKGPSSRETNSKRGHEGALLSMAHRPTKQLMVLLSEFVPRRARLFLVEVKVCEDDSDQCVWSVRPPPQLEMTPFSSIVVSSEPARRI
jgi:hypothetical protein